MVTEEQKKVFKERLDEVFTVANEALEKEEVEATGQLRTWLRNLYFRYKNYKNNTHPANILPKDHLVVLEAKLNEENLNLDEFEKTEGRIDLLIETIKTKKEVPKEMTLEEMEKFRDETEEECRELERKLNKRKLFRLTDEQCAEYQKQIDEYKAVIRDIKKKIDELTPKKEEPKESEAATKKIEELLAQKRKQDDEIASLKEEVAKYKEERAYLSSKYRSEYEKKLEVHSKELEEKFEEKLKDETEKQVRKSQQKAEETKQLQKKHIRKLLLTESVVSLDDMKFKLKTVGVSASRLEIALNELRNEIPGIVRVFNKDGILDLYSVSGSATNRLEALKAIEVCPKISNVMNGQVKFIIRADLHKSLKCTESDMKKALEPFQEYSTLNKNIPIVDLGDVPDTLEEIEYKRWVLGDKEAAEQIYT